MECVQNFLSKDSTYIKKLKKLGLCVEMAAFTIGSLLYPKDMMKNTYLLEEIFDGNNLQWNCFIKQFHDALYNFSLEKI